MTAISQAYAHVATHQCDQALELFEKGTPARARDLFLKLQEGPVAERPEYREAVRSFAERQIGPAILARNSLWLEVLMAAVTHPARVTYQGHRLAYYAILQGNEELLERLLEPDDSLKDGEVGLWDVAKGQGDVALATKLLLRSWASAAPQERSQVYRDDRWCWDLLCAVQIESREAFDTILATFPIGSLDSRGWSILHQAAVMCYPGLVEWLLSAGAEVSLKTVRTGKTPLHQLISSKLGIGLDAELTIAKLLTENGASLAERDQTDTTVLEALLDRDWPRLFHVATNKQEDLELALRVKVQVPTLGPRIANELDPLRQLTKAGWPIARARDEEGNTILHWIFRDSRRPSGSKIRQLIELGADPLLANDRGELPIRFAPTKSSLGELLSHTLKHLSDEKIDEELAALEQTLPATCQRRVLVVAWKKGMLKRKAIGQMSLKNQIKELIGQHPELHEEAVQYLPPLILRELKLPDEIVGRIAQEHRVIPVLYDRYDKKNPADVCALPAVLPPTRYLPKLQKVYVAHLEKSISQYLDAGDSRQSALSELREERRFLRQLLFDAVQAERLDLVRFVLSEMQKIYRASHLAEFQLDHVFLRALVEKAVNPEIRAVLESRARADLSPPSSGRPQKRPVVLAI